MLILLKTDYFKLWFLFKRNLRISTAGKQKLILRNKQVPRKTNISPTYDLSGKGYNWNYLRLITVFANGGCQSLLQSTRMGSHPLLMVDIKVYYSQREYIATFAESICIHKFKNAFLKFFWLFECWLIIYL